MPGAIAGDPIALGLGNVAGLMSLLPNVIVKNELVVREVKDDCPLKGKVQDNDVIESLSLKGKELPARSTLRFYEELAFQKPGTEVTVAVRGKGNINVKVGQGTDDSKPLFSMFFVPGEKKQLDWIGWSPIGPYETSHPRIERYIGWHFNTGDPKKPAWVA